MKSNRVGRRMGLAAIAGGLAFVGAAEATELMIDGSFENTQTTSATIVKIGGKANPGVNGGWTFFSTYAYSAQYTMPLTNGAGINIGGAWYLRPYPPGVASINQSSTNVSQIVSLTATTTLTPTKIDGGQASYSMSAWFSSYLTQGDFSDLTLTFLDASTNAIGTPVALGGQDFVNAIPTGANAKYSDAKFWAQDVNSGIIPAGSRMAQVLIQSTSVAGSPDGYVDVVSLDVVDVGQTTPVLASSVPANNAVNVGPIVNINVGLQDRVTAVNTNTIRLSLDNNPVVPTIQKLGTNTTVSYSAGLLPALSVHTYSISFSDNGTPVTSKTNVFSFTVANYLTLPQALSVPLGSEDATKPGFNAQVYQVDALTDPNAVNINIPDSIEFDEALLVGVVDTNIADLSSATVGDTFTISNTVHWANSTGTAPNFPNPDPFPGIPGTQLTEENFVNDIRTWVRFPAAGFYQMGVNNNNAMRLSAALGGTQSLLITTPTNLPIAGVAIATNITQLSFGGALPSTPLTASVVYGTPSGDPNDSCFLATNSALASKIALIDRGTNCLSSAMAHQAQLAGALAVIETTPGDTGYPFRLDDNDPTVTIPVFVIGESFGGQLLKSYLTNHVSVTATIQADPAPRIVEWDGPKIFGSVDVISGFAVPKAGLYPLRLVAGHTTGGADLEWFSIQPDGTRILINDTSNTNALFAFRAVTRALQLALFNPPVFSAGSVTLSWSGSGTLLESTTVNGSYQPSANQSNPQTFPATGSQKFYRIKGSQ